MTGEDEDGKGAEDGSFGRGGRFRERVVVLDVFLEREMSSKDGGEGATRRRAPPRRRRDATTTTTSGRHRELVERWVFHAGAMGRAWVGIITSTRI